MSDVRSPLFGHVLARGAFAARFGPTAATVAHVREVLGARGLVVGVPSSNHLQLTVTGDAAQVESAFTTTLRGVQLPGGARGRIAGTVLLPASISGDVEAVLGLDQLQPERSDLLRPRRVPDVEHALAHRASASALVRHATSPGAPSACAHATDETEFGYGGITQDEVAHAYGVDGLYAQGDLGQGQTVAVFELEPFERSDLRTFEECYFGADHTSRITVVDVDGGTGTGYGSGEAALDIENVAAIAPDANIRVYEAPNNAAGAVDDYNRIVSDDLAQVATTSWGLCESDELHDSPGSLAVENLLFEQAASQGQTFFSAAGDAGNDACAYHGAFPTNPVETVGDPASQPYVVGVGGTSAVTVTQPPTETVWNDGGNNGGGGGGISRVWVQPPWLPRSADVQSSATRCGAPRGTECRTVPDVSAFADEYTGITTYFAGTWLTVGGTSSSAPLWAAMLAEVNASATCRASVATSRGVGFVAPLLYDVASRPADYAAGFTDVTVGNNDLYGVTGGRLSGREGLRHGVGARLAGAHRGTGRDRPGARAEPVRRGAGRRRRDDPRRLAVVGLDARWHEVHHHGPGLRDRWGERRARRQLRHLAGGAVHRGLADEDRRDDVGRQHADDQRAPRPRHERLGRGPRDRGHVVERRRDRTVLPLRRRDRGPRRARRSPSSGPPAGRAAVDRRSASTAPGSPGRRRSPSAASRRARSTS